jgi:hypothetical protein
LDRDSIKAIRKENSDPHLIQNIEKLPLEASMSILHSEIKGGYIDLIAKADLSTREIGIIAEKNLHKKTLREYLKNSHRGIDII